MKTSRPFALALPILFALIGFAQGQATKAPPTAAEAAAAAKAAAETREAMLKQFADLVDVRFDQPYAGNENPKQMVDVYLPKKRLDDKPLPVVVFIHGGGWSGGDRKSYVQQALGLVASGKYAAVAVGYRLSGEIKWPAQIYDCKAAIRYVRGHAKDWNIDPEKIGVTGTSAGGHLVSLLGVSGGVKELEGTIGDFTSLSSRVTAVINICGPTDMGAPLMQGEAAKKDDPAVSGLFGASLQEKAAEVKQASPLTYVSKDAAPTLTIHGTKDGRVDFKHGERFHAALKQAGATSYLLPMVNAGHGIPSGPELKARQQAFWDKYLRGDDVVVSAEPIEVPVAPAAK